MKLSFRKLCIGVAALILVMVASSIGSYVGQKFASDTNHGEIPLVLNADSATTGKAMSMATGLIDRGRALDGLFVLDHLSGLLQCWVVNPRNGEIAGIYSVNVTEHLALGKGGDADYVMTTGNFKIEGKRGNAIPAGCICYVGDGNTGKVVGFSLYYDKQVLFNNETQTGEMFVVARGVAREVGLRRDN